MSDLTERDLFWGTIILLLFFSKYIPHVFILILYNHVITIISDYFRIDKEKIVLSTILAGIYYYLRT